MIFLNIKLLEEKLIKDELPSKHVFIYFLISSVLLTLSTEINPAAESVDAWFRTFELLLTIAIVIVFSIHFFNQCRSSGKEKRFLEFYFSLGFVVGLRLVVFMFLAGILIAIFLLIVLPDWDASDPLFELIFGTALSLVYFLLLMRSFQRVTQAY